MRKPDIWTTVTNDCEGEDKEEAVRGLRNEIGLRKDDRKWEERNCSKSRRQIKGFKCNLVDHWYNQLYCYCTVLVVRSPSSFLLSTSLKSASLLSCIYCQAESSQAICYRKKGQKLVNRKTNRLECKKHICHILYRSYIYHVIYMLLSYKNHIFITIIFTLISSLCFSACIRASSLARDTSPSNWNTRRLELIEK